MAEQNQTVSTEGELISEKAVLRLMNYIKAEAEGKSYTLPVASDSTLGGVKIGEGINISEDGTISVPNSSGSSTVTELNANKVHIDETHTLADKVTDWDNKVDKVTGKGLSSNDFTNDYKEKIDGLSNYDDTALSGRVTNLEDLVPETASSSNKLATLADIPAGGSGTGTGGITNYPDLTNKPKIAGVELVGDKSLADLGVQPAEEGKSLSSNDFTNEYKTKLDNLNENAKDNVIESISVNGIAQTITNKNVNITVPEPVAELNADKVNIDETHTLADKSTDWNNKVDKVSGKGLSTEDYTTEEKNKLAGLSNYDDTALDNRIDNIEELVPTTASKDNKLATMADIPNGTGGTTNYEDLENKPSIAGTTLSGDKTLADLGIQPAEEGKGLSVENYTTEEKTKLAGLSNYDDTTLAGKIGNIEELIPSAASKDNKLVTMADLTEHNNNRFIGTHEEWEALTEEEQALYTDVIFTDDNEEGGGGSSSSAQDINDFLKIIAPTFSNLVDYSAGDLCIYQGELCKCVIDHSAGEWDDTHFGVTNLANEIYISGNEEIPNGDDLRY